jgi:large subunit ribosomal protein L32
MPNPKRKHSKARRDKRRSANSKIYAANLSVCPQCKSMRLPHKVCAFCGYYNGKPVLIIKVKEKKKK